MNVTRSLASDVNSNEPNRIDLNKNDFIDRNKFDYRRHVAQ